MSSKMAVPLLSSELTASPVTRDVTIMITRKFAQAKVLDVPPERSASSGRALHS